jgi:hypothetical protein
LRAAGITNFLENGGSLEAAQRMAGHADSRTTKQYDRRDQRTLVAEQNESGTPRNSRTAMPEPETETLPKFLFSIPVKAYWIDPGATFIFCLGWVPLAL